MAARQNSNNKVNSLCRSRAAQSISELHVKVKEYCGDAQLIEDILKKKKEFSTVSA